MSKFVNTLVFSEDLLTKLRARFFGGRQEWANLSTFDLDLHDLLTNLIGSVIFRMIINYGNMVLIMKTMFNLTTDPEDMDRYDTREDLLSVMDGFDGVELLCYAPDLRNIIPKERVIGIHMSYYPYWFDFWRGDKEALIREFDSMEACEKYYGGTSKDAMIKRFRKDLEYAKKYEAEYVVFHVADATIHESYTRKFRHSDEEVIDAVCEVIDEVFAGEDGSIALLFENLWLAGLTFTDPLISKRLLDGVKYPNKGFLLDTGHLMHMNTKLATQEEGLQYIHEMLDLHGDLAGAIRGVHLHQSLTGEYAEQMMANPPPSDLPYQERNIQSFYHAVGVDKHELFTCEGVHELIDRIAPDYLTFEFFSKDLPDLREKLSML